MLEPGGTSASTTNERGWLHAHQTARLSWEQVQAALADSCLQAVSCLLTYWLATTILVPAHSVSKADDVLGGLWTVIATAFVLRHSCHKSLSAGCPGWPRRW